MVIKMTEHAILVLFIYNNVTVLCPLTVQTRGGGVVALECVVELHVSFPMCVTEGKKCKATSEHKVTMSLVVIQHRVA